MLASEKRSSLLVEMEHYVQQDLTALGSGLKNMNRLNNRKFPYPNFSQGGGEIHFWGGLTNKFKGDTKTYLFRGSFVPFRNG